MGYKGIDFGVAEIARVRFSKQKLDFRYNTHVTHNIDLDQKTFYIPVHRNQNLNRNNTEIKINGTNKYSRRISRSKT